MNDNRRNFIKKSTALAALSVTGLNAFSQTVKKDEKGKAAHKPGHSEKVVKWPVTEGPNTPHISIGSSINANEKEMQQIKQMGADCVLMGGPRIPWTTEGLRTIMDRFKAQGLTVVNMMIAGHPNTIYGRPGRDEEIENIKKSIIAAGEAGLPVIEYNFYADRFMEGYYEKKGRGGSGITAFDYDRGKNAPPKPAIGTYTAEQLWANLTYFLKAIIPVAEKAGVRMALHPNDPGVPISHGSAQIIATFDDWKRLVNIVKSPSNGMTFDCGVSREMGYNPIEVFRYLRARDCVNQIHYRNVTVQEPHMKYEEVFFDTGIVNMFAMMREIIQSGYKHGINPEHPRFFTYDLDKPGYVTGKGYPGGSGYSGQSWNVAYTRAMMQAVWSL